MLVVLFFCKILYEGCYHVQHPHGFAAFAMANTDGERAALSSARGFGSMIGNVIPMMILPQLLAKFGDTSRLSASAPPSASIGFVFCFLHYYWTEERNVADTPKEEAANVKFTDILSVFKKNRAFLALCIHGVCICCMQYVGSTLGTYMYSDVLGNIGIMSLASVVSMPLSIVALLIMPKLAEKFGLEKVIRTCLLIGCGLYMGLFVVMMLFSVPAIVYLVWSTMASGIASVSILMQWGLVGEAIDYNELLTGKRTEGSIYGTFNLSRRIGQTVGNSAAVLALGWIGYDANLAAQSAGTLTGIKALCVLVPGIFLVGSWIAFRFVWNITPEIRAKMAASKAAKSAQ
ncbi:MAG: MFS transporter [Ruthenibacterium lactatiformans]